MEKDDGEEDVREEDGVRGMPSLVLTFGEAQATNNKADAAPSGNRTPMANNELEQMVNRNATSCRYD